MVFSQTLDLPPLPDYKTPLAGAKDKDYQFDEELNLAEEVSVEYEDKGKPPPAWTYADWTGFIVKTCNRLIVSAMPGAASERDIYYFLRNYFWKNPQKTNFFAYELLIDGIENNRVRVLETRKAHDMNGYLARVWNKLHAAGKAPAYPRPMPPSCAPAGALLIPIPGSTHTVSLKEFRRAYGINHNTFMRLVDESRPIEDIVAWCKRPRRRPGGVAETYEYDGKLWTRRDIANHLGCSHVTVLYRLRNWGSDPRAIARIIETPVRPSSTRVRGTSE